MLSKLDFRISHIEAVAAKKAFRPVLVHCCADSCSTIVQPYIDFMICFRRISDTILSILLIHAVYLVQVANYKGGHCLTAIHCSTLQRALASDIQRCSKLLQ